MKTKASKDDFNGIITLLKELNKAYPNQGVARHLHEATLDYSNLWGMKDSELLFALTKYKAELEMNVVDEKEVEEIVNDGMNLGNSIEDLLQEDTEWDTD